MTEALASSAWAPFRNKTFRALWLAQFVSNVGTWMQSVGAVWVMLQLRASPTLVALVATASSLPVVFFGIVGGALADLVDRRRLLLLTQTVMLLAASALAIVSGRVTPNSLLAITFLLGVGTALNGPAWQAIQPELVPHEQFPQAVTLGGASINLGRAEGSLSAGAGDTQTAGRFLAQAVDGFERLDVPFEAARTREALASVSPPDAARGLLERARDTYEALGAALPMRSVPVPC